jgi:hypothetical protein
MKSLPPSPIRKNYHNYGYERKLLCLFRTTVDNERAIPIHLATLGAELLNLTDILYTIGDLAEDNMLGIQPTGFRRGDEELRTIST